MLSYRQVQIYSNNCDWGQHVIIDDEYECLPPIEKKEKITYKSIEFVIDKEKEKDVYDYDSGLQVLNVFHEFCLDSFYRLFDSFQLN